MISVWIKKLLEWWESLNADQKTNWFLGVLLGSFLLSGFTFLLAGVPMIVFVIVWIVLGTVIGVAWNRYMS